MRARLITALVAGILAAALLTPAVASAYTPGVALTSVKSVGKTNSGTGSSAAPAINAEVATVDNGVSINSTGVGTGFQRQGLYVSVLYENGSQATGAGACLPAGKVNFGDRIIGAWVPDGSSTRVLAPVTEIGQAYAGSAGPGTGGQLVGNWDRGTVSVRMVNLVKPPTLYANLQACGRVHTTAVTTPAASNVFGNGIAAVSSLYTSTKLPSLPTLKTILATPTNPLAPTLPVSLPPSAPVQVPVPGPVQTVTQTVSVPAVSTQTITTPGVTVTLPGVTVTAPTVTVTVPGLPPLP